MLAVRQNGGLRTAAATSQPFLQTIRGLLLAAEICVMVAAFTLLGLIESHAVFACYPLLVAALSGPILGERVGWRRWMAIAAGFLGVSGDSAAGRRSVFALCRGAAAQRGDVCALWAAHPLCRSQG